MARRRASQPWEEPEIPEGWSPKLETRDDIDAHVDRLPLEPGVYIMRDRKGRVVYVGKARRLRNRVRQYFSGHDTRFFVPMLARLLGDIETIVVSNDKEALLLENNLIKKYRPRFNVKLRDDKQYLVLRLDPSEPWPRLRLVRDIEQDGAKYFGPYHSASRARQALRVVNRHFQLRTCTDHVLNTRKRPCLQHQIGRCPAPCVYDVDAGAYADQVDDVALFLGGRHKELLDKLRGRMKVAADALEFETAARVRDQLGALETSLTRQQVVGTSDQDQDVVGMYREGGQVELVMLHVRGGQLMGSHAYSEKGMEFSDEAVLAGFVNAYYDASPFAPDELVLPASLEEDDQAPLEELLRGRRGRKVVIWVPERGDRKKLVSLANRNAASNFVTRRDRKKDGEAALRRLQTRLGLSRLPTRIECFDISHIQGSDPVASMVVFVDGEPDKKLYRSFKIKGTTEGLAQGYRQNDDFASMYEVLGRRLRRGLDGEDDAWTLPDLLVIDGGKGQLSRVIAAMEDLGVEAGAEGVDVVSLAKERRGVAAGGRQALETLARFKDDPSKAPGGADESEAAREPGQALADYVVATADATEASPKDRAVAEEIVKPERVFTPGARDPIRLMAGSSELYLMTRIRDEAHRFAISHHRKRRGKRALKSSLDDIPGVGPALKRELVRHFGSVKAIKAADAEALRAVKGVGPTLAKKIREHLG